VCGTATKKKHLYSPACSNASPSKGRTCRLQANASVTVHTPSPPELPRRRMALQRAKLRCGCTALMAASSGMPFMLRSHVASRNSCTRAQVQAQDFRHACFLQLHNTSKAYNHCASSENNMVLALIPDLQRSKKL